MLPPCHTVLHSDISITKKGGQTKISCVHTEMRHPSISSPARLAYCSSYSSHTWPGGFLPSSPHPAHRDIDTWYKRPPTRTDRRESHDFERHRHSSWDRLYTGGSTLLSHTLGSHMVGGRNRLPGSGRSHPCHRCTAHTLRAGSSPRVHTPLLCIHSRSSRSVGSSRWGNG